MSFARVSTSSVLCSGTFGSHFDRSATFGLNQVPQLKISMPFAVAGNARPSGLRRRCGTPKGGCIGAAKRVDAEEIQILNSGSQKVPADSKSHDDLREVGESCDRHRTLSFDAP